MAMVFGSQARRSRLGNMAEEQRRDHTRRWHDVDDRFLRSRAEPGVLGHGQSESGAGRRGPSRRQPLYLFDCGAECRHRKAGVVLPAIASRRWQATGTRSKPPCFLRWRISRKAAQDGLAQAQPQWLLLRAGSQDRRGTCSLTPFVETNWAKGINTAGQPIRDTARGPTISRWQPGIAGLEWFHQLALAERSIPQTRYGLRERAPHSGMCSTRRRKARLEGQGGGPRLCYLGSVLEGIDYKTGEVKWKHEIGPGEGSGGIMTTVGKLLFSADTSGNLLALESANRRNSLAYINLLEAACRTLR